ncbi:hypothetical protein ACHAXA_005811 [Cyclostephanos tholiformis]|uniref:Uncharacterized protein n=1 Tax=Cyclostephanos tholiformis TaxID=382380 RepID=A0ABD3RPQ4_9STRA
MGHDGDGEGKSKQANLSQMKPEIPEEHSFSGGGAILFFQEGNFKEMECHLIGNRSNEDTSYLNNSGVGIGIIQSKKECHKNQLHGGVGRPRTNFSHEKALHELLLDNFHNGLASLRESTLKVLQISYQEKERLCLEGEILEARIAYMRLKIGLARDQLLKRGVVLEEEPNDLRLSMVLEGEESLSSGGDALDLIGKSVDKEPITLPTESLQLKGCIKNDDSGMPGHSRTSFLRTLNWLSKVTIDQSIHQNEGESSRSSEANIRLTFIDGADDGMPSRWRAREQRANKMKEEENRSKEKDNRKGEEAPELIFKREKEISVLEKRASSLELDTLSIRDEVSILRKDLERAESKFQQERTQLLRAIDRIELENEKLDHVCLSEGVLLEERKISIEILANELKGAREELVQIQNERDRRKADRRKTRNTCESRLSDCGSGSDGNCESNYEKFLRHSSMSALTLDSLDLVDILEQMGLEHDK